MTVMARTARLELREFATVDAPGLFALNKDPEVLRYTGDVPFADEEDAREFIRRYDSYATTGYGRWSVYLSGSGQYIGWCGLRLSPASGETDLGFRLFRNCWGMGYATEAARASLDLGFNRFCLQKIAGRAMRDNRASHAVLRKLGMIPAFDFIEAGQTWVQYELAAEDYRALQRK
jgi:[ribosomal protein S5]-alanine N-acetyltransferase